MGSARRWRLALVLLLLAGTAALWMALRSDAPRPDLKRLYQVGTAGTDKTPVILIPGAFGSRLRERAGDDVVWHGSWWRTAWAA